MGRKFKLDSRDIAQMVNEGIVRPAIDGSLEQIKTVKAAPEPANDNKNRSWTVGDIERDWEGFITSLTITET